VGIAKIMQPRTSASTEGDGPPSIAPEAPEQPAVSRDLVPVVDSSNTPVVRKPRKPKPKPITDKKLRKVVGLILTLKIQGKSRKEIAEELELTENTVKTYLWRAKKRGYLQADSFDDPNDVIETLIKSTGRGEHRRVAELEEPENGTAVDGHDDRNRKGNRRVPAAHDREGSDRPRVQNANVLKVQIVMPPNMSGQTEARTGAMGGRPAVLEGEVVEQPES
jgi:hypothetical protein